MFCTKTVTGIGNSEKTLWWKAYC